MFRIVISIIRGTCAGRAMRLMASGLQCSAETIEKAREIYDEFLDCAYPLQCSADADTCFGMVSILNTKSGAIEISESIMGKATVVREKVGAPGELPAGRR